METITQLRIATLTSTAPIHIIAFYVALLLFLLIFFNLFFAYSIYKTAKLIPSMHHRFPIWFIWFFIIPILNAVFQIIMLTFDLPRGLTLTFPKNTHIIHAARVLFNLGVIFSLLMVGSWLTSGFKSIFLGAVSLIFLTIYWVKAVRLRRFCKTSNE